MDTDSKFSAASGLNQSSGSVPAHSCPNSEYLGVQNNNSVDNVVSGVDANTNINGSDVGSETDEGFVSGGEEFDSDSISGKAAVVDPDEHSFREITEKEAVDASFMGSSEFSMSEVVRPIAKVSTDDDAEGVEWGSEDEGLAGEVVEDNGDKKDKLGVEVVSLEDDKFGLIQTESAKDENFGETVNLKFGENVELSGDGGDKKVEDEKLGGDVLPVVEGGLASEKDGVQKFEVMDEKVSENQSDDSLKNRHQIAPTEDENAGGVARGNSTLSDANDHAKPNSAEEPDGVPSVQSDDVKLSSEGGDSIVEKVEVNLSEPGVVVVGDVKGTRDLDFQGVEAPANGVSLANGVESNAGEHVDSKAVEDASHLTDNGTEIAVEGQHAKNTSGGFVEKNGNLGAQSEVDLSDEGNLGSFADQQNGDGEIKDSAAKPRDSVVRVDNDQIEAVPVIELNRVHEVRPKGSEVVGSAISNNERPLHDVASNFKPVADEGESKNSGEYNASENLGPNFVEATDREGRDTDEEIEDSITDGETEGMIFESSEAAKQFLEELEKASGVGSQSTVEDSHDPSQKIDGQIVTDSDEVDTDEEGESKELFDTAALAALLKAARGTGSDGGSITITSQDGSRLFSVDRPAGLGSSLQSVKPGPRPSQGSIFSPSSLRVEADSESNISEEEKRKLENLQQIRIKFLRLVQRLGFSPEESMAAQVLYRLTLVAGRQTGGLFSIDTAKRTAAELEAQGRDDLNFTANILVLGKAGVGKSATINSIFGETKTQIDAYGPATCAVREIIGVVGGVTIRVFDTPGLKSSAMEQSLNRKILSNVKKFTKKCPPDIVLYVDRLDMHTRDLNDLPLLRSITSVLGSSIWRNVIVTLTHAACAPPDGPTGSPLSYDVFVAQRSHVVQQTIGQAVGDLRLMNPSLMNPVSLAENHPSCRKNRDGEKVLPNGQSWRPQLLLLCYSMKILSEASNLSKPKDPFDHRKLFGFRVRSPPLPYLLSWLLQSRTHPKLSADQGGDNGDSDIDMADLSDSDHDEDEDEYDQLPAFKPLRKSQIAKLSREQKKAYFDEYDYRVKLLQKKQWREELKRMREMKKKGNANGDEYIDTEEGDGSPAAVPVPLPDMVLPPSFDGDNAAYRYRFLEPTSQFLTRPVLDTHGWDHDCGYDGVNLEHSLALASQFPAAYSVQITKDKKDFNLHLDSSIAAKHGENGSTMVGFDIQNIGKQLAYIVRGESKFKNFKRNKTAAGLSVTFLGENVSTGLKVEDQIVIGKRLVLVGSTGTVRSQGDSAYGANMEVRIREADYPIGQDQSSLGLSLVNWRGDLALGANFQSQFSVGRSYKMAVRAGLNNKLSGQISVRTSSSDQLQIALVAILPVARAIYKSFWPGASENYSIY